jgi:sec-independent protein translocase protein TatC
MNQQTDDELFRGSVMTFGEHLGELRICLWKAIFGLAIGFAVGLCVGQYVVRFIQTPLIRALEKFYETQSEQKLREQFGGEIPPEQLEHIRRQHMIFDEVYIDPQAVVQALREQYPDQYSQAPNIRGAAGGTESQQLLPLKIWRKTGEVSQVVGLNPMESFMVYMKASLLVGLVLSSPWVFYQLWTFVAAGLYHRERHYVHVFLPFSLALFIGGVLLAFFAVFPVVLKFLFQFNAWLDIGITPRISEWLSFALLLPLAFGVSFQLPLVMLFLERIGVFTVQSYVGQWRVAVLAIFVLAMLLSPSPDPQSMLLMALPLVLLYFGGIELCKRWPRQEGVSK